MSPVSTCFVRMAIALPLLSLALAFGACGEPDPCDQVEYLDPSTDRFDEAAAKCIIQQNREILDELQDDDTDGGAGRR